MIVIQIIILLLSKKIMLIKLTMITATKKDSCYKSVTTVFMPYRCILFSFLIYSPLAYAIYILIQQALVDDIVISLLPFLPESVTNRYSFFSKKILKSYHIQIKKSCSFFGWYSIHTHPLLSANSNNGTTQDCSQKSFLIL